MAHPGRLLRCNNSVRFRRNFLRAGETAGCLFVDPLRTFGRPRRVRVASATRRLKSPRCSTPSGGAMLLGRAGPADGKDGAEVLGQHLAKAGGVARQRAPFVPQHDELFAQWLAPVCHAEDPHLVVSRAQRRRNDGNAVTGFRHRHQRVGGAAFQENVGLQSREPACGVEHPADHECGILQDQRMRRQSGRYRSLDPRPTSSSDDTLPVSRLGPTAGVRSGDRLAAAHGSSSAQHAGRPSLASPGARGRLRRTISPARSDSAARIDAGMVLWHLPGSETRRQP